MIRSLLPLLVSSEACLTQDFVARLHNNSMQYVVIVDPGIKVDRGYSAYDKGLQQDIFIKDVTGKPYLGQVTYTLLATICT